MKNKYGYLSEALKNILISYPDLKGILYSIYFWKPDDNVRSIYLNFIKDILLKKNNFPEIKEKIWYLITGELPSKVLNLEVITKTLMEFNVNGSILYHKWDNLKYKKYLWDSYELKRISLYLKKKELQKIFFKSLKISKYCNKILRDYEKKNNLLFPKDKFIKSIVYLTLKHSYFSELLLKKLKPVAIITGINTSYFISPFLYQAKKNGVKVFIIQHGEIGDYEEFSDCDYYICWGEYYKNKIKNKGIQGDILISLGSPRMDNIIEMKGKNDINDLKKKYNLLKEEKILLHISDGNFGLFYHSNYPELLLRQQINDFAEFFENISKKYKVLIKLHPNEKSKNWEKIKFNENIRIFDDSFNIYELILISDIVTTVASIAGFEASLLGKPVIYYAPGEIDLVDYPKRGLGFKAKNSTELKILTEKILEDPMFYIDTLNSIENNKSYFISNIGKSSKVIASFIKDKIYEN